MSEATELPTGWTIAPIGEFAKTATGGTPSRTRADYFGGNIPWVKSGELGDGFVHDVDESLTQLGVDESNAKVFPKGTLCVALYGATVGKLGILGMDAATNQAVCGIFLPHEIDQLYLFHFLASIRRDLVRMGKGGAQSNISNGIVRETCVPLAPLNEQRRIVSKIEELFSDLDAGVAALKRAKANLKRYRAAVLKAAVEGKLTEEWRARHPDTEPASKLLTRILTERRQKWEADQLAKFAAAGKEPPKNWPAKYVGPSPPDTKELPELPEGWCWVTANQLCSQITDGEHIQPPYQDEGFPMLTATHVRNGCVEFTNVGLISETDFRRCLLRCSPTAGDVLIVSVGATTGRAGLVQECPAFALVRSVLLLKPIISGPFLLNWIQSPWCQSWISKASGATAQAHLYISDTKRMPVPLPPLREQVQIIENVAERVSQIAAAETNIETGLLRAARLRQSILKQAFEGKLVPQDPHDEPASVLLERLGAREPKVPDEKQKARPSKPRRPKSPAVTGDAINEV